MSPPKDGHPSADEAARASLARTAVEVDAEFRDFARRVLPWLRTERSRGMTAARRNELERLIGQAEALDK